MGQLTLMGVGTSDSRTTEGSRILTEDGNFIVTEDGNYLTTEQQIP